jgi:hypothetical protein
MKLHALRKKVYTVLKKQVYNTRKTFTVFVGCVRNVDSGFGRFENALLEGREEYGMMLSG